ncbi:MAG: hypothetical protein R2759_03550 [Bacteroidales bacterium]
MDLSGRFDKFNQLTGTEATYAGHAFWRYIAEKYGESSISNIIYMAVQAAGSKVDSFTYWEFHLKT